MRPLSLVLFACVLAASPALLNAASKEAEIISFEKHVRPILKAHCLECHGEGTETEGALDLRLRHLILKGGDSGAGFVAGKPEESPLYERTHDQDMPPGDIKLTESELATIKQWIATGAQTLRPEPESIADGVYFTERERTFWSFQSIKNPNVPKVKQAEKVRTPIDAFLLRKLEENKLTFSPKADRRTLVRRVYFDLHGLPPTPQQIAEFVNDKQPKAYERLLDRLLASPHYGERWGRHWLDVVGYADSEGFTIDDPIRKHSYKYRDYVINAFNKDKPFDLFVREQLAGDEMIPQPFKNLTAEQTEKLVATGYLRMVADGTASSGVDDVPAAQNQVMADTLHVLGSSLLGLTVSCSQCHNHRYDPIPQTDYYHLRAIFEPAYDWKHWKKPSQRLVSLYTDDDRKKSAEIEVEAKKVDEKVNELSKVLIEEALVDQLEQHIPKEEHEALRKAYYTTDKDRSKEQTAILKKYPVILKISRGSLYLYDRDISVKKRDLNKELLAKSKQYVTETREAELKKIPAESQAAAKAAAVQTAAKRNDAQKKLIEQFPNVDVTEANLEKYNPKAATELKLMKAKLAKLVARAPQLEVLTKEAKAVRDKKPVEEFVRALSETPGVVPDTFFFARGNHTTPEQKITPAVLTIASLAGKQEIPVNDEKLKSTGRRLAYAQYLTSGKHPLVARVLVNRFWMHHFGKGIVATTGDFGLLGDRPSHPELLDWLATSFVNNGWSLKQLHRTIMTSTAYRQQLRTVPVGDMDPDNRLLSGMSLRRLEAEVLRDSILKISGNLNDKKYGKAIPVTEDKVGQIIIGIENLSAGRPGAVIDMKGEDLRRSVYVQVRRSKPLAMLDMFDGPRMSPNCEARDSSTVAPQSLLLMNNKFVIDQSLIFARRVKKEAGDDLKTQVAFAWEQAFSHQPSPQAVESAVKFLNEQAKILSEHPAAQARLKKDKELTPQMQALASFCQSLLSSNQFLYID